MALNLKERVSQVGEKLSQATLIVRARTLFESMSPRDRRLFVMLVSFFALLLVGGGILSGRNYLKRLDQEIQRKQDQLARVEEVRAEHETLKSQIEGLEAEIKQSPNFNLTAFLERQANEVGFTQPLNIQTKGDTATNDGFREIAVDVRIRKAPLPDIVKYLYNIETAPHRLTVKSLRIRPSFGNKAELDVDLEVSLLAPQES